MATSRDPRRLTAHDAARVAARVGMSEDASIDPRTSLVDTTDFVDTTNLVELLETLPPARDRKHWIYTPEERVRILRTLLLADGAPWVARFGFLLIMSVLIATLGLANNQPAAVIAAMVVAPLMTPVLGIACAATLGLVAQAKRLLLIVIAASLFAVALGWAVSASLVVNDLTPEELSRTAPRLRDLVIALAAGSAGMYSVVRKDLSGVVPGVAIAVALVPPLATVGIVLELHEWSLARGAALLYAMNVTAIVVAAIVVLLVTDFMESPSFRDPKTIVSGAAIALMSAAVVVPIWLDSREVDRASGFAQNAAEVTDDWEQDHPDHHLILQRVDPGVVQLTITGPTEPPSLDDLRARLATGSYPDPVVEVEWVRSTIIEIAAD